MNAVEMLVDPPSLFDVDAVEVAVTPSESTGGKGPVAEPLGTIFVAGTGVPVPGASVDVP